MMTLQGLEVGAAAPLQIVAAANKMFYFIGGVQHEVIICGHRHYDEIMLSQIRAIRAGGIDLRRSGQIQGFVDNRGKFHDRKDALAIASEAGQINRVRLKLSPDYDELFSEDLY